MYNCPKKNTIRVFILLFYGFVFPLSAQIVVYPYPQASKTVQNISRRVTPLSLPFFDDFLKGSINSNLWLNSGISVSETMPKNPVSRGVATLDAYNSAGAAYNLATPTAEGFSDTLTSQPIDLSAFIPTSNIWLSFYSQAQGLGEQPDPSDFLRLECRQSDGIWKNVWQKNGNTPTDTIFNQNFVAITDSLYLYNNFQFRFLRYGRNSGYFDVWHIDYVYLNKNRNPAITTYPDISTTKTSGTYLKNLSAMPIKHFLSNPSAFIGSDMLFNLRNLDNTFRVLAYQCRVLDAISNTQVATLPITALSPNAPLLFTNDNNFDLKVTSQVPTLPPNASKAVLQTRLEVNTADNNVFAPPIDFRQNDTLTNTCMLDDYYAYDDGTAEYVAGVNQRLGRIAVKYDIAQSAQLTAIDICFIPFLKNLNSQTVVLSIWRNIEGRTQEVVFQQAVPIKYANQPNGFVRFSVDSVQTVIASGTIYIGIQQGTEDLVAIGFDANNNSMSNVYYNTSGIWEQEPNIKGSLMIRPVFATSLITQLPREQSILNFRLYPNPAQKSIEIQGENIIEVTIFNLQGIKQAFSWDKKTISFDLPSGLYILEAKNAQGHTARQKIVIEP